jgi:uncharacterized protein
MPLMTAAPLATPGERTITVSGDAEVRVVPDQVQLSLGIISIDRSLAKAKSLNDERIKRTLAALRAQGIDPKHVQTDHLSAQPRRDSGSYDRPNVDVPEAYEVRRNVMVTVKDLKKLEAIVTAVLDAGANEIDGLQFLTTELRKHRDTARAMALKAAREKAAAMAAELGMRAGRVRTISEHGGGWSYWSPFRGGGGFQQNMMQNMAGGAEQPEDGFAPGMISVKASVGVVFDLDAG